MSVEDQDLLELAQRAGTLLEDRGLRLITAESCTGGWIAKVLTDVAGSSQWFERGVVVYSNAAKIELLGVSRHSLQSFGAVSREVAAEMARGAVARAPAEVSLAVTGIAGPDGGTPAKPVGLVWLAWYRAGMEPATCE
ncbi:MAG TPA: nicotinamide-nucleotide amidohydrolase family protein, partial [Nitrococcus sp.]|nr:nicotinamide-nucleotide amidohydrolase family protein [Nitrococcus sp.]